MATRNATIYCLLLLVFVTLHGCDAPRDNPIDNPVIVPADEPTIIESFSVKTRHTPFQSFPTRQEKFIAITEVDASDADGIEAVYLEISDTLRFKMSYDNSANTYLHVFNPSDLNDEYDISSFGGSSFYAYVFDRKGFIKRSERQSIVRVLYDVPVTLYPKAEIAEPSPTLSWRHYGERVEITYTVEVAEDRLGGEILFREEEIPRIIDDDNDADTIAYCELPITFEPTITYLWTVTVIDLMGNETVSEETKFKYVP